MYIAGSRKWSTNLLVELPRLSRPSRRATSHRGSARACYAHTTWSRGRGSSFLVHLPRISRDPPCPTWLLVHRSCDRHEPAQGTGQSPRRRLCKAQRKRYWLQAHVYSRYGWLFLQEKMIGSRSSTCSRVTYGGSTAI